MFIETFDVGTLVGGRYRLVKWLGTGGMGEVWKAEDIKLDQRPVAIKFIAWQTHSDDFEKRERFLQEMRALARLNHPNIVQLIEFDETAHGTLYLVMNYVPGGSLKDRLASGGLDALTRRRVLEELCDALDYIHDQNIVHRDLKPSNILFDAAGHIRISDFGLAKLVDSTYAISIRAGTPGFEAPEQRAEAAAAELAQGKVPRIDHRADIYALGVIAWLLFTERHPDAPTPLPAGTLSPELKQVLRKALAHNRKDRYDSASEFLEAVISALPFPGEMSLPAIKRLPLWVWGVAGGVILLLAVGGALLARYMPGATPMPAPIAVSIATPTETPRIAAVTKESTPTLIPTPTQTPTETPTLTLTPTHTPTPTLKPMAMVQVETLDVHSGPGMKYDVLGQKKQGDELVIVARTEEGDWLQVQLSDGKEGWVSAQFVKVSSEVTGISLAAVIPPTPTPVPPTDTSTSPAPQDMVYVPTGEFIMGSDDEEVDYALQLCNRYDCDTEPIWSEQPQHKVYLDAFWIDRTEVTNAKYQRCMETGVCQVPRTCDWGEPTYGDAFKAEHPVVCVSWHDAKTYCEWVRARLPTEAEWEKAARGTDGWIYPWGNVFDGSKLNFCDVNCPHDWRDASANDGYAETAPVGSYPAGASPYGVLDMVGNVWEWVADWYEAYPGSSFQSPYYGGQYRVIRGGAWYPYLWAARCAGRYRLGPWHGNPDIGFRCAMDAE